MKSSLGTLSSFACSPQLVHALNFHAVLKSAELPFCLFSILCPNLRCSLLVIRYVTLIELNSLKSRSTGFFYSMTGVKADSHSPISGARATFSERHFAITWCVSNYTSATPTQNEGFKIQSFAAYSECIFRGQSKLPACS